MSKHTGYAGNTWQEDPREIIILANRSGQNYILELPTGHLRLDNGRRIRTLRSIMKIEQIQNLIDQKKLVIETS